MTLFPLPEGAQDALKAIIEKECPWLSPDTVDRLVEALRSSQQERANELLEELRNIANAKPSTWGEMSDQFQAWAQNRARTAIAKYETPLPASVSGTPAGEK